MSRKSGAHPTSIFYGERQRWIGLVLLALVVGYHFGRPTLEQWTGWQLPNILQDTPLATESPSVDTVNAATNDSSSPASRQSSARDDRSDAAVANRSDAAVASPASRQNPVGDSQADDSNEFPWKKLGRNDLQSPAGLIYAMGPRGEHRLEHVMLHRQDNPQRPVHGVFRGTETEVLELIDDAFRMIQRNDRRVRSNASDESPDRTEHVVEMGRPIGFKGGRNGAAEGNPPLRRLKLIIQDDNRVITVFPF